MMLKNGGLVRKSPLGRNLLRNSSVDYILNHTMEKIKCWMKEMLGIKGPVTANEKIQKKNDVKARSMLLMALLNEHLLTFNQYKDAKTLFAAIQKRFGGNDTTKKTQKTLLKQMYENFSAPSTDSLDSIFNRLQKIRNKLGLDTMIFDDLYNNFKIVEQEVKGTANSSSSSSSQNMAFVSSPSSTNEVNTAYGVSTDNIQVSTARTQVSTASTQVSTANLSDATVYAFLANQPNRKITINGSDTTRYDKSKVECFNYHKLGHFVREYKGPRNQDNRSRNQDSSRRTINVEEISSKAMLAIDGAGFDWSFMADEEVPTNMALMAFSDFEFNKSEFNLATYRRGLASIEEKLFFYKKNEVIFCEQLDVLKRDISYKDSEISVLKSELEKLKQEKENNQLKIENFDNASKSLDKLIGSQITDKSRKGLEEFQQPKFEGYGPKTSKSVNGDTSNEVRESSDAPLVEELVSNNKLEKKTIFPTVTKINFVRPQQQEKPVRKHVKLMLLRPQHVGFRDLPNLTGHPQKEDHGYVDNRCSRHMTGNMSYLSDFKECDGGYVTFGGGTSQVSTASHILSNAGHYLILFWQTATASTLDNGVMEITATIDGKVKIVTEASIRRHLKLEISDRVKDQQSVDRLITHPQSLINFHEPHLSPTPRTTIRQETKVPQPNYPTHINVANKAASTSYIKNGKDVEKKDKAQQSRRKPQTVHSDEEVQNIFWLQRNPSKQRSKISQMMKMSGITWYRWCSTASTDFTLLIVPVTAEWEDIQARIEADEELAQRLQAEEREKYSEAEKARLLAELINQRKRHFAQQRAKEMRNKPRRNGGGEAKSQKHIHDITWRLYDTCRVHHVSIKDGIDIYMLVEREYPLSRGVLTQMLVAKLLVEQNNEMSRELLRKIFMQIERPRR
ncbi:hypothetical protein Tco_0143876 [Tanacetum coccineum]